MTDRLKPCPFCGGEAELIKGWCELNNYVMCLSCRTITKSMNTKESAIEAWNTRKPMDRIVEEIESMFNVDPVYYGEEAKWAVDKAIEIVKAGGKND